MRRWLLLPLLLPLMASIAVGLLNRNQPSRLRLLVWTTPTLPLGSWVLIAAAGGALLSAGVTVGASAGAAVSPPTRRQVRYRPEPEPDFPDWDAGEPDPHNGSSSADAQTNSRRAPQAEPSEPWPERSPHDAPPTVSVPFRVVKSRAAAAPDVEPPQASPHPMADDWSDSSDDEW